MAMVAMAWLAILLPRPGRSGRCGGSPERTWTSSNWTAFWSTACTVEDASSACAVAGERGHRERGPPASCAGQPCRRHGRHQVQQGTYA
jgi:hypothetical protein